MVQPNTQDCVVCSFKFKNMPDLNKHMAQVHCETDSMRIDRLTKSFEAMESKAQEFRNLKVNYKSFDCTECGVLFKSQNQLKSHIDKVHTTKFQSQEEFISPAVKITPDQDFLTKNTADLKIMLEGIPKEALWYEEDVFEKDFKEVLNSVENNQESNEMTSFCCEECNFRGTSLRCLKAHICFVHNGKFYKCDVCPMKTRTELALHYHIDIKHNSYWEIEEEGIVNMKNQKQASIPSNVFHCHKCNTSFDSKHNMTGHFCTIEHQKTLLSKSNQSEEGEINIEDLDKPTDYQIKPWGLETNEGYLFEGKRDSFGEAHAKIKGLLGNDMEYNLEKTKFSVEGSRNLAYSGIEFIMKVEDESIKGKAVLRFYGPNRKKEFKIVVTKCKEENSNCVKLLAESVVRHLIDNSISGKGWSNLRGRGKEQNPKVKCSICDKAFSSEQYMKGHKTRVHKEKDFLCRICDIKFTKGEDMKFHMEKAHTKPKEKKRSAEPPQIECIKCSKSFITKIELMTHDKTEHGNKVIRFCEMCDMEFKASTLLENLLEIQSHKFSECSFMKKVVSQTIYECTKCNFTFLSENELKKHMRDDHEVKSASTSPAPKKSKKDINEKEEEICLEGVEDCFVKSFETMDLDEERGLKRKDIDEDKSVSEKMDKKVLEKRAKQDLEHEEYLKKKTAFDTEQAKLKEEEKKQIQRKNQQDKAKLQMKEKPDLEIKTYKPLPPHLKEIPASCKKFFNHGSVVYIIPGNGNCGPACGAAHLVGDETLGPNLRRAMNCEIITERDYYKNRGYWCDKENPFEREIQNSAPVKFTDPKDMYEFLASSESDYMYSDSEDFLILANMFGMSVKIVRDLNPPNEHIVYPDPDMKHCMVTSEDMKVPDLTILFQNGNHFNLIVSHDSDLAKFGNQRKHFNNNKRIEFIETFLALKKQTGEEVKSPEKHQDLVSIIDATKDDPKALTTIIEKLEIQNRIISDNYKAVTCEMKNMREQVEFLKIENRTLKEEKQLREQIVFNETDNLVCIICGLVCSSRNHLSKHRENHNNLKVTCTVCNKEFKTQEEIKTHKEEEHGGKNVVDVEYFSCMDCPFQDPDKNVFFNHRKIHTTSTLTSKGEQQRHVQPSKNFICRNCKDSFINKRLLMNHRRDIHPFSRRQCRYDLEDSCSYPAEECWYRHSTDRQENGAQTPGIDRYLSKSLVKYKCHECSEEFRVKNDMMIHKKNIHPETCMPCEQFAAGKCTREKECWYLHKSVNSFQFHTCHTCKEDFRTKSDLMLHKKQVHPETCKPCEQFVNGDCPRNDQCWNIHQTINNWQNFQQGRSSQVLP